MEEAGKAVMTLIALFWLVLGIVVVLAVLVALLGVVRAVFALPLFVAYQPYTNVAYALIVLLLVIALASWLYGGGFPSTALSPHR